MNSGVGRHAEGSQPLNSAAGPSVRMMLTAQSTTPPYKLSRCMMRAVKLQFIFVFIIIAISPCPTYAYSKRVINVQRVTCVTNDL